MARGEGDETGGATKTRAKTARAGKRVVRRSIGRPKGKGSIGKEMLIARTEELLRTLPPEKLSLTAAARHAGVHLTLFKYYFQDRTRLLVDIARNLTVTLGERVAGIESKGLSPPERLRIRIDVMVDFHFENPFYHRLMLEVVEDEQDPLAGEMINVWMSRTLSIYEGIITSGVEAGTLRRLDTSFTYLAIMGLCEQFHYALRLFDRAQIGPPETPAEIAGRYKSFLYDLVFKGLATPAGQDELARPQVSV